MNPSTPTPFRFRVFLSPSIYRSHVHSASTQSSPSPACSSGGRALSPPPSSAQSIMSFTTASAAGLLLFITSPCLLASSLTASAPVTTPFAFTPPLYNVFSLLSPFALPLPSASLSISYSATYTPPCACPLDAALLIPSTSLSPSASRSLAAHISTTRASCSLHTFLTSTHLSFFVSLAIAFRAHACAISHLPSPLNTLRPAHDFLPSQARAAASTRACRATFRCSLPLSVSPSGFRFPSLSRPPVSPPLSLSSCPPSPASAHTAASSACLCSWSSPSPPAPSHSQSSSCTCCASSSACLAPPVPPSPASASTAASTAALSPSSSNLACASASPSSPPPSSPISHSHSSCSRPLRAASPSASSPPISPARRSRRRTVARMIAWPRPSAPLPSLSTIASTASLSPSSAPITHSSAALSASCASTSLSPPCPSARCSLSPSSVAAVRPFLLSSRSRSRSFWMSSALRAALPINCSCTSLSMSIAVSPRLSSSVPSQSSVACSRYRAHTLSVHPASSVTFVPLGLCVPSPFSSAAMRTHTSP